MSRSWTILFALAASAPLPAAAQAANTPSDEDRAIAEKMMSAGGRITPDKIKRDCTEASRPGEIVVCARDENAQRVQSDTDSGASTDDGRLHPPDFAPNFQGVTVARGCFIPPCPPAQPYIIDLSTIPVAPAGSDADKIAKGELRAP